MDKSSFLNKLRSSRARWEAALADLDRSKMETPVEKGTWSVKDIIAHVTWFEREMVDLLNSRTLIGSDLWNLPQDERNAAIYKENRNRQLSEVLAEASQVYQRMLAEVENLTNEELNDPKRFKNMPEDWLPWEIVAQNTYEHYDAHLPDIEKTS
jgi:uncharacterized damage-inducible protein DinB